MGSSPLTLRVFVSSPHDVASERQRAHDEMTSLEAGHLLRGKIHFDIVVYDDEHASVPMDGRDTPQASVIRYSGLPSECDLTLVILWSRIGTLLPPNNVRPDGTRYQSGTVWEYEDAVSANKAVFVYRRSAKPQIDIDDPELERKRAQYSAVNAFFAKFTNPDGSLQAGFNTYTDPAGFGVLLRQHLEAFVNNRLGAAPPVTADDPRVHQILTLIDELGARKRQLDEKDAQIARLRREIEDLRRAAIARTLTAAGQPDAGQAAADAVAALDAGDTRPAEQLLGTQEREEAAQFARADADNAASRREAARLARQQGALAMDHDVRAALAAYQRATEYEPEDLWTHIVIGDLHVYLGDSNAAMQSYRTAAALATERQRSSDRSLEAERNLAVSQNRIGDVLMTQGNLAAALASYRTGLTIVETLAARDPSTSDWQRDVSVSHNRIGDVLAEQNDLPGALASYRSDLAIMEALVARDPANVAWQRDLSVSHDRIGNVLAKQGDSHAALDAYRKSLAIAEGLVAREPANLHWQRDLAVSRHKISDVLVAQGDMAAALASYRAGHAIAETLAAHDPANTQWQRDLSLSANKLGDALIALNDASGARAAYEKGLAIAEALVARDRANALWLLGLATSYEKLGAKIKELAPDVRRDYLQRGRDVLLELRREGRLLPSHDTISWFDGQLRELETDRRD